MATICTTARNLCAAVWRRSSYADVRGEGKKRVHYYAASKQAWEGAAEARRGGDHGKDQGGVRERSTNRP